MLMWFCSRCLKTLSLKAIKKIDLNNIYEITSWMNSLYYANKLADTTLSKGMHENGYEWM